MVRAALIVGPHEIEVRDLERPPLPDGWGWLRVEACGLCGTDAEQYEGSFSGSGWPPGPLIPGHEVVGIVEELPDGFPERSGVGVGDRVALEPNIPCGVCRRCLAGAYVSCAGWPVRPFSYGFIPLSEAPGLWGGWAEGMVLHPRSVVHRVPDGIEPGAASVFNALATAFEWVVRIPRLQPGQSVLVQGAGQRGLAGVVAARAAGAGLVVVSGVSADRARLAHARRLGADHAIDVDDTSLPDAVAELTGGIGVDLVVDTSAGAVGPVADAVRCVADGGVVILAGLKAGRTASLDVDRVVLQAIRIVGVRSASWASYEMALDLLARDQRLCELRTHVLPLDRAADAARALATADPDRVYVSVVP